MLVEFWSRLNGAIHPDDVSTFANFPSHGFNLDYPPPAYWGDVRNAPILILDNNGGYDPNETPAEFASSEAIERHLARLRGSIPFRMEDVPPYYQRLNFADWLAGGQAALINAVAYRSLDSNSPNVRRLAKLLPSANLHRRWLREVALPQALRGERLLIIHRWSLWNLGHGEIHGGSIVWSTAPRSPNLTRTERVAGDLWLTRAVRRKPPS